MDYEVFLLSRIREEHDGHETDTSTVQGVARTGRLVSSAALILFLAFIALSRVPATDVKILATALALGIVIDATIVRGVLALALVALLGPASWWLPSRRPGPGPAGHWRRCPPATLLPVEPAEHHPVRS
jgi:RND superfamily putative drug exporter